jgi:hypothetical protein
VADQVGSCRIATISAATSSLSAFKPLPATAVRLMLACRLYMPAERIELIDMKTSCRLDNTAEQKVCPIEGF